MSEIDYSVRNASLLDRSRLANLIHFSPYVHQHLDWKSPLDWIGKFPYLVIERNGSLVATLACPPDLPEITWVRLFAVGADIPVDRAWKSLWSATIEEFSRTGKIQISALSLQGWFNTILKDNSFEHTDNVIVLMYSSATNIPEPKYLPISIQPMYPEDIPRVVEIDHAEFTLEWRNSKEALELAYQQASWATVAVIDKEIVGYQYSTSGAIGGHLARLAVAKTHQGQGIGYSLVYDVINHFKHQGVRHVSVNTQQNNQGSLALYEKAGFEFTGESYRVYQYILSS